MTTTTSYQHAIEDFIRTAEANGHCGRAMLSSAHPAIHDRQWMQIRKLYGGVLADYRDELGNLVELRTINGKFPVVQQHDPRRPHYVRFRGSDTGIIVKAECFNDARIIAAKQLGVLPSSYLVVSLRRPQGVVFAN